MPSPALSRALDALLAAASPVIVQRGDDYFRGGCVRALGRSPGGRYLAVVSASAESTYRVFVTVVGDSVTDFGCNCPYDAEPVCKHLAAVFRAIQAGEAVAVGEDLEEDPWDWLIWGREDAARKVSLERGLRAGNVAALRACLPLATRHNVSRFYAALDKLGGPEAFSLRRELSRRVYGDPLP